MRRAARLRIGLLFDSLSTPERCRELIDALNLRVHVPGVSREAAREQIVRLGDEVLDPLRDALA